MIKDNFRKYPSVIREWDHLVGQMLYLARTKKESEMKDKYDMIEMMSAVAPEVASPPRELSKCKMQSYRRDPGLRRIGRTTGAGWGGAPAIRIAGLHPAPARRIDATASRVRSPGCGRTSPGPSRAGPRVRRGAGVRGRGRPSRVALSSGWAPPPEGRSA